MTYESGDAIYTIDCHHFAWREPVEIDGQPRLVVPMSDPMVYEYPFDHIYATPQEAIDSLMEYFEDDDPDETYGSWVLIEVSSRIRLTAKEI